MNRTSYSNRIPAGARCRHRLSCLVGTLLCFILPGVVGCHRNPSVDAPALLISEFESSPASAAAQKAAEALIRREYVESAHILKAVLDAGSLSDSQRRAIGTSAGSILHAADRDGGLQSEELHRLLEYLISKSLGD